MPGASRFRLGKAEPRDIAEEFPSHGSVFRASATGIDAMLRLLGASHSEPVVRGDEEPRARLHDPLYSLVARAVGRDRAAEQTLLTAIGPAMIGVVRRVLGAHHPEVDDVCQEASVGFLSALPGFRSECTVLHFACRIALLAALAARRRRDRVESRGPELLEEPDDCADGALSPADLVDAARRRFAFRELLQELPIAQAEVLAAHVVLGHTVEETSAMMHVSVNTVRSRLRRGLVALRERLRSNNELRELVGGRHE
jgi:RNA polymerase sigma factor (sigma-70 family)